MWKGRGTISILDYRLVLNSPATRRFSALLLLLALAFHAMVEFAIMAGGARIYAEWVIQVDDAVPSEMVAPVVAGDTAMSDRMALVLAGHGPLCLPAEATVVKPAPKTGCSTNAACCCGPNSRCAKGQATCDCGKPKRAQPGSIAEVLLSATGCHPEGKSSGEFSIEPSALSFKATAMTMELPPLIASQALIVPGTPRPTSWLGAPPAPPPRSAVLVTA